MTRFSSILLLLLLIGADPLFAAGSMRCNGRIVSEGMSAAALLLACGEPAYRDVWDAGVRGPGYLGDTEEWYYNFGANQLLRVIKLRSGNIFEIGTEGYGFDPQQVPACTPNSIVEGLSKFRLVLMCGPPLTRRAESLVVPYDRYGRLGYDPRGYYSPVYRELWTYNFGSAYLLRLVTLDNGRVTDVQSGDRGSD